MSALQGSDEETQERMTEIRSRLSAGIPKHPTLDELEVILASEGTKSVEMLPSGEIVAAGLSADARFLLSRVDSLESALREATGILDDLEKLTGFTASALHDELITMQAEIETGREDTARLDWIQAERSAGHSVAFSHSLVALMEAAQRTTEWDRNGNIREAIDAAKASR